MSDALAAHGNATVANPEIATANRLLTALAPHDWALLAPHLRRHTLEQHKILETPGKPVERVWFLDHGFASILALAGAEPCVEAGIIGREGMTGLSVVLQAESAAHEVVMQGEGGGLGIAPEPLRAAMEASPSLRRLLLRHVHALLAQIGAATVAFSKGKLEDRLARWLLMVHNRVTGDEIVVVHACLARMLGVRRAGVTLALHELESRGLIRALRGRIIIVDRKGLQRLAGPLYGAPEAEYARLLG